MSTWGNLRPGTDLADIFPDGRAPLQSIVPIQPDLPGAPLCYVLNAAELSEIQITALATRLYAIWQPECESYEQAEAYIRDPGLPVRISHFETVTTTDLRLIPLGGNPRHN